MTYNPNPGSPLSHFVITGVVTCLATIGVLHLVDKNAPAQDNTAVQSNTRLLTDSDFVPYLYKERELIRNLALPSGDNQQTHVNSNPPPRMDASPNEVVKWAKAEYASVVSNVAPYMASLSNSGPTVGREDAPIAVIEFIDYRCGFCKAHSKDISKLLESNSNVKLKPKFLPLQGTGKRDDPSMVAAKGGYAAMLQGVFPAYHHALLSYPGQLNIQSIIDTAKTVPGLDIKQFERDIGSEEAFAFVNDQVSEATNFLGKAVGTPTYIVDKISIQGAVGYEVMQAIVDEAESQL